jgi:hypothetical protein
LAKKARFSVDFEQKKRQIYGPRARSHPAAEALLVQTELIFASPESSSSRRSLPGWIGRRNFSV